MAKYLIPSISAIIKAPAPITGGIICPPVEATASPHQQIWLYPELFIRGIVNEPVVATLAVELHLQCK